MNQVIVSFKEGFSARFGLEFPLEIPGDVEDFGNDGAILTPIDTTWYEVSNDLFNFVHNAPDGYFFAGFLRSSDDGWFFCFCKATEKEKLYFKLPYTGDDASHQNVVNKLCAIARLEEAILDKVREIRLQDTPEGGFYRITFGEDYELEGNYTPEFDEYDTFIETVG